MKKNLFMFAAVALLATTACTMEIVDVNSDASVESSSVVFTAGVETRTALVPDNETKNHQIHWVSGDKINIDGVEFSTTNNGAKAYFTTESPFTVDNDYIAVYPATAGMSFDEITVPATQEAVEDNFNSAAVVSVAKTTTTTLDFKNLTSILKFQVPAAASKVTISADQPLAGTVKVDWNNGEPTWVAVDGKTSNEVTVTGSLTAGVDYYVAVLPGTKTNFTVRIDGYLSRSAESVTPERSMVMNMKTLPAPIASTYKLMGISGDWNTGKTFYEDLNKFLLLKSVTFSSKDQFKFCQNSTWGRPITFAANKWAFTYDFPNDNMTGLNGTYDIWVDTENDAVCFVPSGNPKPAFNNTDKLIHVLYEATENCGLYIQSPSSTEHDYNNSGAWGNYAAVVYMHKSVENNQKKYQNYCAFPLPSNAVGKSCKFTIRVWGDKNKTYTLTLNDDTPFWGNSDNGNYYQLSSKINIQY